jgi:transposase
MSLVREMPVKAAARITETTGKRLWRVIDCSVTKALASLDLTHLKALGLDETAAKRGQRYVTVFIDMQRKDLPVVFATPGKGKETLIELEAFLKNHQGDPGRIREVVCDMSSVFLSGIAETFPKTLVTVDSFHIVQTFTGAVDAVRKAERQEIELSKHTRGAGLKRADAGKLTVNQKQALAELIDRDAKTATAWLIKEKLAWVRQALTPQAARWRLTHFVKFARSWVAAEPLLAPMAKALNTLENHAEQVVRRWTSTYTNARLEGFNSLLQAARARARGYRNEQTFITMIYLVASPVSQMLKST